MTNDKNNPLFNAEVKESYLNEIKSSTRQSYERIFRKTEEFEVMLNKDINQFTEKELDTVLYSFKANNRNTIESYGRIISAYLNWSVKNDESVKENVLDHFRPEDFEKYLTTEEEYISENKLRRYEDRCENFQDAVILHLLFMGVSGRQMSEVRNLKREDVDFKKMELRLVSTIKEEDGFPVKFTYRYLKVDERTLYLIQGAINQKTYVKRNGFMQEHENIRPFTDLVENDYVVRASITKTDGRHTPVDKFVIYRRVAVLSETLGVDLTAKFIQRSGMISFANELIKDERLELDDLKLVANRFGMKSHHNLKGFLTVDNVRKVYPKQ